MDPPARWRRSEYLGVADAKSVEQARKPRKEDKRGIFVLSYEREYDMSKGCLVGQVWTAASAGPSLYLFHILLSDVGIHSCNLIGALAVDEVVDAIVQIDGGYLSYLTCELACTCR